MNWFVVYQRSLPRHMITDRFDSNGVRYATMIIELLSERAEWRVIQVRCSFSCSSIQLSTEALC